MTPSTSLRERFAGECGGRFFLDPGDPRGIEHRLHELGWFTDDCVLGVQKIGDGNMNLTVRVTLQRRTVIVKQARPWVEKYPTIAAPVSRAVVEATFYGAVITEPAVSGRMPALLGADSESFMLVLEDVPHAADLTSLYAGDRLTESDADELAEYLSAVHALRVDPAAHQLLRNREMRALNHAHQYEIPLDPATGHGDLGAVLRRDEIYRQRIAELGRLYLSDGMALLHGDFFPGSWLRTPLGLSVIDPEFCFLGPAEYDLGILAAHWILTGHEHLLPAFRRRYAGAPDWHLVDAFAGAELMRRLIGVAQLPLRADLEQKREWLARSRRLVCG